MELLQPQEVEVYYVLPAIRREFSKILKEGGMTQKRIAELLGVTPAAVSQYLHEKRAKTIFPAALQEVISEQAETIDDKRSMMRATQAVLDRMKESKLICRLHAAHATIPKDCEICFR